MFFEATLEIFNKFLFNIFDKSCEFKSLYEKEKDNCWI